MNALEAPHGERNADRETRLRARIDEVRDQRDKALELLWEARADIALLEQQLKNKSGTGELRDVRASRDMWRKRARDAERMLLAARKRKPT